MTSEKWATSSAPSPTVRGRGAWRQVEIELEAAASYPDAYTAVDVWVDFGHESGFVLRRPAFWDGGRTWRVRFAGTVTGEWTWRSAGPDGDPGLDGRIGRIVVEEAEPSGNPLYDHWSGTPPGLCPGGRRKTRCGSTRLTARPRGSTSLC
jgi:hypothetical protein